MTEHIEPRLVEPRLGADRFSCPYCNAVAQQDWYSLFLKPENPAELGVLTPETVTSRLREGDARRNDIKEIERLLDRLRHNALTYEYHKHSHASKVSMANLHVSNCHGCNRFSVWVAGLLVFPTRMDSAPGLADEDAEEAAAILDEFPRGATALMRVCIQKLLPLLEDSGRELDQRISSLVRKGLEVEMKEATEVFQYLRSDTAQLGQLETHVDKQKALRFLDSLQAVLERRMPKAQDE